MAMMLGVKTIIDHPALNGPSFMVAVNVIWVVHAAAAGFSLQTTNGMNMARDLMPRIFWWMIGMKNVFKGSHWFAGGVLGNFVGATMAIHLYNFHVGLHRPKPGGDDPERHTITCPECLKNYCSCEEDKKNN